MRSLSTKLSLKIKSINYLPNGQKILPVFFLISNVKMSKVIFTAEQNRTNQFIKRSNRASFAVLTTQAAPFSVGGRLGDWNGSNLIGRIERALNFSSWDKIYIYAQYVNLTAQELLSLQTRDELHEIVEKSLY